MPITQTHRQSSISKDSIAGYDHRGSVAGSYEAIAELSTKVTKKDLTPWKKIYDIIPRFIKATRLWVMNEQLTAMAGRTDLASDTNVASLAYNTDYYINLTGAWSSGGGREYPLYSEHLKHNGDYSVFYAPAAGDYFIHYYFYGETTDAADDDYIQLLVSWRGDSNDSWVSPDVVAGNVNQHAQLGRIVCCNGTTIIRLERGDEVKFGLRQIGKSATWASFDIAEARVIISKQKFYPKLTV